MNKTLYELDRLINERKSALLAEYHDNVPKTRKWITPFVTQNPHLNELRYIQAIAQLKRGVVVAEAEEIVEALKNFKHDK